MIKKTALFLILELVFFLLATVLCYGQEPEVVLDTPTPIVNPLLVSPLPSPATPLPEVVLTESFPQPPDLLHVRQLGCHIDAHRTDPPVYTLNAKTGEREEQVLWWVTPFAAYQQLPDGKQRGGWQPLEKDDQTQKPLGRFVGTGDYLPRGATDLCSAWMRATNLARQKEARAHGHGVR